MNQHNQIQTNLENCPLWTALVTPLDTDGNIDFSSLTSIALRQQQAGNGILLLGSTGEGLALTDAEQRAVVEAICQLQLFVPLMVAVGGYNLAQQLAWVEYLNQLPIDAYLLGSPLYAKPGAVGQTHWFGQLLDAAERPCMLYNVPSRSGVEIPLSTVRSLAEHPNFWAMKEASGNINKFVAYRQACPTIALFSGDDALLPALAAVGAQGLVSVCANAWPEATQQYVRDCLAARIFDAVPLWTAAIDTLFEVANPVPVKVMMHLQKQIAQPQLRPPLTHLELTSTANLERAEQQIQQWFWQQQEQQSQAVGA